VTTTAPHSPGTPVMTLHSPGLNVNNASSVPPPPPPPPPVVLLEQNEEADKK